MARTNFISPLTGALFLLLAPFGGACNGRVVSLGNTGDTLQPITGGVSAAAATPVACPAGWAHPNICCTATANSSPACGAWEESPFRACDPGATTYPDPLSCCSLSDPKNCTDTPDAPVASPPPSYGCGYVCPPGWWAEATSPNTPVGNLGPMCCEARPGEVALCVPQANGATLSSPPSCVGAVGGSSSGSGTTSGSSTGGSSGGTNGSGPSGSSSGGASSSSSSSGAGSSSGSFDDAGYPTVPPTPVPDDAGVPMLGEDAGCAVPVPSSPYGTYDGGAASLCGECPTGWSANAAQPELCCQTAADGTELCFSQATGSATSPPVDGGSGTSGNPSSGWGSGGANAEDGGESTVPSCEGSDSSCSCKLTYAGHAYALECSAPASGAAACSCTTDGVVTKSVSVDSCQDSVAVTGAFSDPSLCGYP